MKTPIEPSEIRKGDLIRWESGHSDEAHEYRAECAGHNWIGQSETFYLLDRPTPPVVLPTEPTLGWLSVTSLGLGTGSQPGTVLAFVNDRGEHASVEAYPHGYWSHEFVTAFVEATAIPTGVLDAFRTEWMQMNCDEAVDDFVGAFLDKIDSEAHS